MIVGGGAGGFAAAEMLRRKGYTGALTLLSADADKPYDRPNCSKDFLAGEAQPEWMPLRDDSFYRDNDIDLRLNTEVESLDLKDRSVQLKGGDSLAYDVLILATGAEPQRPDIPGLSGPNVFTLRQPEGRRGHRRRGGKGQDGRGDRRKASSGLEAAAALKQRGLDVHVVAPETIPFEKLLGAEVGRWAKALHEEKGVVLHLGRKVLGFQDGVLEMDEGRSLKADFVVVGAGGKAAHDPGGGGRLESRQWRPGRRSPARGGGRLRHRRHRPLSRSHLRPDDPRGALGACGAPGPACGAGDPGQRRALCRRPPSSGPSTSPPPSTTTATPRRSTRRRWMGRWRTATRWVKYEKDGKLMAILTIDRDLESLKAEAALEG